MNGRWVVEHRHRLGLLLFLGLLLLLAACGQDPATLPGGLPSGEDVLYSDDFSPEQDGEWNLEGDEQGQALVMEEHLVLEINAPNTIQYATLENPSFADFILEVDVTQWAGSLDSTFGILYRIAGPQQFYRFALTGNGLYMVERHNEDGTWTRLLPEWQQAPTLQQGLNQTNHLALRADGGTFSFYLNDLLLTEVADGAYPTGNVALSAGTFGQTGLRVAFDNLVLRRP